MNEKRESVRHDSLNLVSYILYNSEDEIISSGVGRTLNISKGGILLEIDELVEDEIQRVRMEIAIDDNIITMDGEVRFTLLTTQGYTECGIQFNCEDTTLNKYIEDVLGQKKRKPRLLRSKEARIENLEAIISNEHKILSEYIDTYKSLADKKEEESTIINISKLLSFLRKDLSDHFFFEENVVFKAASSYYGANDQIINLVEKFKVEHITIMKDLDEIISFIGLLMKKGKNIEDFITRKIFLFMGKTKKHAREEMELLVPLVDNEKEIIMEMNNLLSFSDQQEL